MVVSELHWINKYVLLTHSHTHACTHAHTCTPPPPPKKKRTKTWKTQTDAPKHTYTDTPKERNTNLIFLAEATGIGSTADDVEGRGSGESLFRYWLVLLWSSFFFPTFPALAEFVDCSKLCSKLCPCLFLAFSTTKSSLNLWNTAISCKTSKRRVKSKWPAQQASANHNVRFRHVTRFSQSLYKGLNSATSVWGCFRQLNLGSCYWNWATVIVRFFLSKMSGGLPGFVEYN